MPPGQFTAERFTALAGTSTQPELPTPPTADAPACDVAAYIDAVADALTAPMFGCHKAPPGPGYACAGWLASGAASENLAVRLAIAQGRLPVGALSPRPGWPDLYPSYEAMAAAQAPPTGPPTVAPPPSIDHETSLRP